LKSAERTVTIAASLHGSSVPFDLKQKSLPSITEQQTKIKGKEKQIQENKTVSKGNGRFLTLKVTLVRNPKGNP